MKCSLCDRLIQPGEKSVTFKVFGTNSYEYYHWDCFQKKDRQVTRETRMLEIFNQGLSGEVKDG